MRVKTLVLPALALTLLSPLAAQKPALVPAQAQLSYADVADLALASPIVAQVRVRKAEHLKGELAGNVSANARRYLVTADVTALIRGSGGVPPRITYVYDARPDALGKWPKLDKRELIVFALPVPGKPADLRLAAPDGQQNATPALASLIRAILGEAAAASAPPQIRGVGDAFHVAGAVPGEGETQIFLNAADGRPLSLSVWRAPNTEPRWAVSVGEIVDQGAEPPARDTLLWYRLACTLPQRLPEASAHALEPAAADIAAADYATIIAGLGPCSRTRGTQSPARTG